MQSLSINDVMIFGFETFPNARNDFHLIEFKLMPRNRFDIFNWCNENLGWDHWGHKDGFLIFENESDAMLFKLRWM